MTRAEMLEKKLIKAGVKDIIVKNICKNKYFIGYYLEYTSGCMNHWNWSTSTDYLLTYEQAYEKVKELIKIK